MSGIAADFINTIELAHDDRLEPRRRTREPEENNVRRGGRGDLAEPDIEARAVVNAGSVVSFVRELMPEEKSDVLYSTQLAQRAASAKHDRFVDAEAWYSVYAEVLERLGWVGRGLAFKRMKSRAGDFTMADAALDAIVEIATGGQLAILIKAIDAMKALVSTKEPIQVFELQALNEIGGNFQLGSVRRAEDGSIELALGAFHFRSVDVRGALLFWKWGDEKVDFWTAAQIMTLNGEHYAPLRSTVRAKLGEEAGDYLVALEVV